eukprot:GHVP01033282.1.p1 GENE.GHVP01033282.1~~GHVP01033282.1.p1  ORF type:complete len:397 (+),score=57.40 GHVP01033282.1:1708-2898(+)
MLALEVFDFTVLSVGPVPNNKNQKMRCHVSKSCWRLKTLQITAETAGVKIDFNTYEKKGLEPKVGKDETEFSFPILEHTYGKVYGILPVLRYIANLRTDSPLGGLTAAEKASIDSILSLIYEKFEAPLAEISCKTLFFGDVKDQFTRLFDQLNEHFTGHQFFCSRISVADLYLIVPLGEFFQGAYMSSAELFGDRPALRRWALTLSNQKVVKRICNVNFEKKVVVEGAEDETPKKKSNPLDSLPPSTMVLDAWKRAYSNTKDLHGEAMTYFWQHFDAQGYTLWHMVYNKLEDECKINYATSNLLNGFLQRIDADFRKYSFAVNHVLGETGNFNIEGLWMIRGNELPKEITEHPSFEYHTFTRFDSSNPDHKRQVTEFWCNDETINGVRIEDSKVWK